MAGLAFPPAAGALDAPEVFYAEGDVSSTGADPAQSVWHPLPGAHVATLGPEIGVRIQDSQASGTAHTFKIEALSVPDGRPSQDPSYWGRCNSAVGQIGQIGALRRLEYEGPGTYTIRVTAFKESEGFSTRCASGGVAQTVSFSIDSRPAVRFTAPTLRADGPSRDSRSRTIGLVGTFPPLASGRQTVCALGARIAADGSISGRRRFASSVASVPQGSFTPPGRWTCVARAFAGVTNPPPGDADPQRGTTWSAPASAFVRTGLSFRSLRITDANPPGFALLGRVNRAAAGGRLTLRLSRARGCPRALAGEVVRTRVRPDGSFRLVLRLAVDRRGQGKVDTALWRGPLSFGGNRLVPAARRFATLYPGRSVGFIRGAGYLRPAAERRLKLFTGGGCNFYA